MRKTLKRCLSVLLALAIVLSGLPMNTLAASTDVISESHVHTDECNHEDEAAATSETSEEVTEDTSESKSESTTSKETTTKSESTSTKSSEKTEVEKVQERMDAFVKEYGFSSDMSDEEIEKAIYAMDGNTLKAAYEECVAILEVGERLPEKEQKTIEDYKNTDVLVRFYSIMEAMMSPQAAATTGTFGSSDGIAEGISIEVKPHSNGQVIDTSCSNGVITTTAIGFEQKVLWITYTNESQADIKVINTSGKKAAISFDWTATSVYELKINGTKVKETSGSYTTDWLEAGESFNITVKTAKDLVENVFVMSNFACTPAQGAFDVTFNYDDTLGSIKQAETPISDGEVVAMPEAGTVLTATPVGEASFLGWINAEDNSLISTDNSFTFYAEKEMTVKAVFVNKQSEPHFMAGVTSKDTYKDGWAGTTATYYNVEGTHLYTSLDEALKAIESMDTKTLVLMNDSTLTGEHTIPKGVTLLIPFDDANTLYTTTPVSTATYTKPTAYRTLTLAEGAVLNISGAVSLSAKHRYGAGSALDGGSPTGPVSFINMQKGSAINVNDGGALYVYGFITGSGAVVANDGATVYENFQIMDFRGGSQTSNMDDGVFPLAQYYVQNIEVPLTIHYGATEYSYTTIYMSSAAFGSSVGFIGTSGTMFNLTGGSVTKYYDGSKDRLMVTANGTMTMSPISLGVGSVKINSKDYELPINGNITVTIAEGSYVEIGQDIAMLPGAEIIIENGSVCKLKDNNNVYVYDAADWGGYCGPGNRTFIPLTYAPGRTYTRTDADLVDAKIQVEGTMDASAGYIYTTAGGANIFSTGSGEAKAGIKPGEETVTYQLIQNTGNKKIPITPAKLKHADGSYLLSAADTYTYVDGRWNCGECKPESELTCTQASKCTVCGKDLPALGHDYEEKITTPATCEGKGEKTLTCTRGDDTHTEEIPATGHKYKEEILTAATCTEAGEKEFTCENDAKHTYKEAIPATGHSMANATCDEPGKCTNKGCNYTEGKPLDHKWKENRIIKTATCVTEGEKEYICENDPTHTKEEKYSAPNNHTWDSGEITTPATCTSVGEMAYVCLGCETATYTEPIPATGHNKIPATCETPISCTNDGCDYTEGKKLDHVWDEGIRTKEPTCYEAGIMTFTCQRTECGKTREDAIDKTEHTKGEAVVKNKVDSTCEEKGYYDSVVSCTVEKCGAVISSERIELELAPHTEVVDKAVESTCMKTGLTEGKHCSVCGEILVKQTVVETLPHNWVDDEITENPTCVGEGTKVQKCANDGCEKTQTVKVAPLGHTEEKIAGTPATCTNTGLTDGVKCSVCKEVITAQKSIPALGHTEGETVIENNVDPTCTENGSYDSVVNCTVCGEEISRIPTTVPANGHTADEAVVENNVEPTCTEKGSYDSVLYCTVCKKQISRSTISVDALEHTPGKEATCEAPQICTVCKTELEPALGHTYESIEKIEATCTEAGKETFKCSVCEATYTKTLEALGHDWWEKPAIEATCTTAGEAASSRCFACGATEEGRVIPALGHKWDDGVITKNATCSEEGSIEYKCTRPDCGEISTGVLNKKAHTIEIVPGKAASCTEAGLTDGEKCSVCGEELLAQGVISPLGHREITISAEAATCTKDGLTEGLQCYVCETWIVEQKVIPALEHKETTVPGYAATCTEDGLTDGKKCLACGEELLAQKVIEASGHNYLKEELISASCNNPGKMLYTCQNDHCVDKEKVEDIPALGHKTGEATVENKVDATCTEDGSYETVVRCTVCKVEVSRDKTIIEATDHTEGEPEVENKIDATCTKDGSYETVVRCTVCGEEISRDKTVVEATDHTEGEPEVENKIDATCTKDGSYETVVRCTVCEEEVSREKEVINAAGHKPGEVVKEKETAPTCVRTGKYDEVVYCTVEECGAEISRETITVPAKGHTEVIDKAKEATCTETGLTEGKHCEVCKYVMVEQLVVKALGHTEEVLPAKEATCTENGLTEGKRCTVCEEVLVKQETIEAKGHTEEVLPAKEATCTEEGLTEGKRCTVCEEVLIPQEEVSALGHSWNKGVPTTLPTCTENGVRTFTCGVCKDTKEEPEPMLGHDLEQVAGKKPTFTDKGWKDYERCLRDDCGYTTYESLDALGEQNVETFDEFIKNLEILENIADQYVKKVAPGKDAAGLIIKYIRTGVDRYNSGSWNIMAGYEDADFAKYVKEYEAAYNEEIEDGEELMTVTGMKNIEEFNLPNGDFADIGHVFGTMDITYTNNSNADVGGWAGDLVDLMSLADQFGVESTTVEEMVKEINEKYYFKYKEDFPEEPIEGTFSRTDVYGDLDAFYIMKTLKGQEYENGTLTKIFENYMTAGLTEAKRASYFLSNRLNGAALRGDVRDAVYNTYLAEKAVATLENTREFNTKDLTNLRKAVCYVFADYLCKLAGDYVETTENDYLEVFQSTSSTLAPGITQKINHATTADGKTMVYYTATADITRSDVNVYANYNNNDPGAGWQMSRVLDQANAAQEKYGNPESPQYIENYNVIASINGDGFNMQTGEPGGLLVMDSVEWHPCDANGFFAILADGTARIGTQAEYKQLKAEGKVKEAIGAFGTSLVKDGKISITASGDYFTDRAGRTAVGITKSGKVVFLVIDGRQGEFSCGASAIEIAQVMLDAGCYQAVNLDGGGSSTYVAREEGAESLAVVSKPSDGAARSVSTSLMMVSTAPSSTVFDRAVLESDYTYLTRGASTQFKASGVSATGNAVELPEGVKWEVADKSIGTISEDGVFTAKDLGTTEVNLTLDGKVVGTKKVNVVIPDTVYFSKDTMNTICGQESVLPVKAAYEGKSVAILERDVILTLANEAAGTLNGFTFVPDEAAGLKKVNVTAQLAENEEALTSSMTLNIYTEDEAIFDFDKANGGDPQLAWSREVSNATTEDNSIYRAIDPEKDMETSYTFAIDMSKIDIPEQLSELTYMLPGADMENASAWNFLLQLAERVSVLTEVKATIDFDDNMYVDYSNMSISNEYFLFDRTEFDKETNTLSLIMKWKDQTDPINPDTANPLCIVTNIKLTPKENAQWNEKEQINVVNKGEISYNIFLRANALFTFASKEENQKQFGLTPFESTYIDASGTEAPERGASFGSVYKVFEDKYSLNKGVKDGWVIEEGGFAYYVDGEKLTGIREIEGLYYDFGEKGINNGKTPCHGKATDLDGKEYYFDEGERVSGWIIIDETDVNYYNPETFVKEKLTAKEKPSTCIIDGYCDYTSESGAEKRVPYDDAGGHEYVEQQDGSYVCSECGYLRVEMEESVVKLSYYETTYTGVAKTPATTVISKNGVTLTKPPVDYPDYSSKYANNVEVGTASVTMTAAKYGIYANMNTWRGNAAGFVTATYEIRPDLPTEVAVNTSGDKVTVSWEAAKAPGVTYVIYATKDGETWSEYAKTDKLSYQFSTADRITAIKIGTTKTVNGKAYNSINTTEEMGLELTITTDNRGDGKPTMKWNAMAGAVSYEVYRATTKTGTYQKVFTTTGRSYTHTSATAGKTYYYKLKVIYKDGKAETSDIVTNKCLVPGTDFVFTKGNRADGKPTLKWNPIIGAASYEVYRATTKTGTYEKVFTTAGVTYTHVSATAGKTYYYKLKVIHNDGTTKTSTVVSNSCKIPEEEITLTASNNTKGKPVLKWNAVEGRSSYELYRATSKNGTYTKIFTTKGTTCTNTSTTAGKTYYYKLKVIYNDGTTKMSDVVSKMCLIPEGEITLTASNNSNGKPVLKWNAVEGRSSYELYRATSKNGTYTKIFTTKGTTCTNTSTTAGKTYYYKLKVIYNDGTTKMSDVVSKECLVVNTKITLTASNNSKGKPVLKWKAVSGASSYVLYRATSKNGTYKKIYTTTKGTTCTNTSTTAGKTYYYKLKVIYNNGTTKTSAVVSKKCLKK